MINIKKLVGFFNSVLIFRIKRESQINYFSTNLKFFWANLKFFRNIFCKSQIFLYAFCESQIFWNVFKIFYKLEKSMNTPSNDFWSNLERKLIFDNEICTFRALPDIKTQKIDRQQYYVDKPVPKSKNILTILMFFLSNENLLTSPIDRSRSQLFRTFFLASWRFL